MFPDAEAASTALGERFVAAASATPRFTVALSGGTTPRPFYRRLRTSRLPWDRVHVFWADERYVPADHPDSNVGMLRRELLQHVAVPESNVHPPRTDLGDADDAARAYENEIRTCLGDEPALDWILLGLGEDGHTASLFPGSRASAERARLVVAVYDSPKPPPVRLTVTPALINAAREIHVLVTGASKREALARAVSGEALEWLRGATFWADRDAV